MPRNAEIDTLEWLGIFAQHDLPPRIDQSVYDLLQSFYA